MQDTLFEIIRSRRNDYAAPSVPLSELQQQQRVRTDFRPFRYALQQKSTITGIAAVIAEIKRGSPSKGCFAPYLEPAQCAADYENGGAACLSVLTEPKYFFGTLDDLIAARKNCLLPVLRKDFIVTEYQVWETAVVADCMLLIARCLEAAELKAFHELATKLRLDVLVEVFDEEDVEKIAPFHFPLIGINNRNLATMHVNPDSAQSLVKHFSANQMVVAASGIQTRSEIESAMQNGIRSFLIGETLSKSEQPLQTLRQLVTR